MKLSTLVTVMRLSLLLALLMAFTLACGPSNGTDLSQIPSPQAPQASTSTPSSTPAPTETPAPTNTPEPVTQGSENEAGPSTFQMESAPETATPTPEPPTATPIAAADTPTPASEAETATATPAPPTATSPPATAPDEPRTGGSWDMEDGFAVWQNPHGDNCSGSQVAIGWQGFTSRGQYGSACFYLNEYGPNVFAGRYSQQVTFDFVDAHAGLQRTFETQAGHRYQVTARLRHVHSMPPMKFDFGYDLSGGSNWAAESVVWEPWQEFVVDQWMTHQSEFVASDSQTTIYIKGFHEAAVQGGATYIDAIEVLDLGN